VARRGFPEHPRISEAASGAKIYKIETNYRSVPEVLELANAAMRRTSISLKSIS